MKNIPKGWSKEEIEYADSLVEQFYIKDKKKELIKSLMDKSEDD